MHSSGLSKSAEVTVNKRYGKCLKSVIELKSIIDDFRMHSLGGICAGIDIFNMTIFPVLTYNSSTWYELNKNTIKKLENVQSILQRCLLGASNSTPILAMNWDLGMLPIEERINENKLNFLHYITEQDESYLSKEIFNIQKSLNFPGFICEMRTLISRYILPNIIDENVEISKSKWKSMVKRAIRTNYEKEVKIKIRNYSKLKDGPMNSEQFGRQKYLSTMNLSDARMNFRLRSKTTNVKMNQKSNKSHAAKLWKCQNCGHLDSQSHIMWCTFFAPLREGLDVNNDLDVVHYFQEVFKHRNANE